MSWSWKKLNTAKKTMIRRSAVVLVAYEVLWIGTCYWVYRAKPVGRELFGIALLPTLAVIALIVTLALYLREEVDEFHRELVVRVLLWGTAGVMTSVCFHGFLQLFGWRGKWPAAIELVMFFVAALAAKLTYRVQHRVPDDVDVILEGGTR